MKSDVDKFLYGDFTPSKRDIDLYERINLYYRQTPDEVDSRTAMLHWKQFKQWCIEHDYTQEEINRAKRNSKKYGNNND